MREAAIALGFASMLLTAAPADAQDAPLGCKVLLCAASSNPSWPSIPYCAPVMQQLLDLISRGGGWPGCPEAGTTDGNIGYQPYQSCPAGSVTVSAVSADSTYALDPNGPVCATAQVFHNVNGQ
ncbi:hypothetical protein SAMN05519104_7743 [Rhizobiales bacterium GAS188]|nr:hypothetical protein SAMN05519104_7743 [Rhizobiales bacterium GAS188]